MRRATPARLGLSCRRAGSPSGRPRSAAPSGSADSRPRGLRRSGGLAPHPAAPRVPAEARRPGPRDGRGTQPRAPWTSGRPSLAGAASSPPAGRMGGGGSALRVCAEHRGGINWLSLSPDGQRLLTGSEDGTARLWSAADGQCCALLQGTRSRGPPSRRPPRTPARSRRPSARAREGCCAGQGRRAELPAIGVSGPRGALCGGEDPLSARCVKSFPLQKF